MDHTAETPTTRPRLASPLARFATAASLAVGLASAAGPLLLLAGIGTNVRYLADDYCSAALRIGSGFWGSQIYRLHNFSGTVTFGFLATLFTYLPLTATAWWSLFILTTWVLALIWAIRRVSGLPPGRWNRVLPPITACTLVLATLSQHAIAAETVYWFNGGLRYLSGLVLLTVYAGLVVPTAGGPRPRRRQGLHLVACAAVAFMAASFAEAQLPVQVLAIVAAIVGTWLWSPSGTPAQSGECGQAGDTRTAVRSPATGRRSRLVLSSLVAGLAGTLIASAFDVLAPGVGVRHSGFPTPGNALSVLWTSYRLAAEFMSTTLAEQPMQLLAVMGAGAMLSLSRRIWSSGRASVAPPRPPSTVLWLVPLVTALMVVGSFAPAVWGLSAPPPFRARAVTVYALAVGLGLWVSLLVARLPTRWLSAVRAEHPDGQAIIASVMAALVLASGLEVVAEARRTAPRLRAQALAWDNFDALARQASARGAPEVMLPAPDNDASLEVIGPDAQHWVNACAARVYGLSVRGYPPPPVPRREELARLTELDTAVGAIARVAGYSTAWEWMPGGKKLHVRILWVPSSHTAEPQAVVVQLRAPNRWVLARTRGSSGSAPYDTTTWVPGRAFVGAQTLTLPASALPVQNATLEVAFADAGALEGWQESNLSGDLPGSAGWVRLASGVTDLHRWDFSPASPRASRPPRN